MEFSLRIVERLPKYLQLACELKESGHKFISSSDLSKHFFIDQNNIKKDLSLLKLNGKPNKGYEINEFISSIKMVLGTRRRNRAIVLGAGNLGSAVANYSGFGEFGLEIIGVFDNDSEKSGKVVGRYTIMPASAIGEFLKKYNVRLAIITVPAKDAGAAAMSLYEMGIRYFWNFAPIQLKLPEDAIIKSENLAASYMVLSYQINQNLLKVNGGSFDMAIDGIEVRVEEALNKYTKTRENMIPILQEVQGVRGYIAKDDISRIAEYLGVPDSKVFGVATFYNQFKLVPPGHFQISVCRGTACHVKGSLSVLNSLKQHLKIDIGETTKDKIFTLHQVACLGACSIAPVIMINDKFYGHLDVNKTIAIVDKLKAEYIEAKKAASAGAASAGVA